MNKAAAPLCLRFLFGLTGQFFQNIALVRSKIPNPLLNKLNIDQVRNHFGGIISVLPAALELAGKAIDRLVESKAYKPVTTPSQGEL